MVGPVIVRQEPVPKELHNFIKWGRKCRLPDTFRKASLLNMPIMRLKKDKCIKYLKVHTITAQLFVCFDEKTLVKSGDAP